MGKHEINRFEVFAREEKGGQVKKKNLFLIPAPFRPATATLQYSVAKNGFIQGQVPSVTLSYILASSTFRQDNT